jgi:hypothetical protein
MARASPEVTLGVGYLIVTEMVRLLERVRQSPREALDFPDGRGGRVHIILARAGSWLADYQARVTAYQQAIEERGPPQASPAPTRFRPPLAARWQSSFLPWPSMCGSMRRMAAQRICPPEGCLPKGTGIAQEGSGLVLTVLFWTRAGPRELKSRRVVIGHTLVTTDLDEAEVFLTGHVKTGGSCSGRPPNTVDPWRRAQRAPTRRAARRR